MLYRCRVQGCRLGIVVGFFSIYNLGAYYILPNITCAPDGHGGVLNLPAWHSAVRPNPRTGTFLATEPASSRPIIMAALAERIRPEPGQRPSRAWRDEGVREDRCPPNRIMPRSAWTTGRTPSAPP